MAFSRTLKDDLEGLLSLFKPWERWLIVINADPDAMASAMALRRIMRRRGTQADIAHINVIARPDNQAMKQFLRIPMVPLTSELTRQYQHFALVDSQPQHSPEFLGLHYDVVLDHHPVEPDYPVRAAYAEIRPEYGAASTLLTEYLFALGIRPGKLLATALLYGIKTDTQSFERNFSDVDVEAFGQLTQLSDNLLLRKIAHADFYRKWLKYFSRAFARSRFVGHHGVFAYLGKVESPDVLVILADFFLRVHELSWDCIAGLAGDKIVAVMRSDGLRRDMGRKAKTWFEDVGSAGGHKMAARAEIPLQRLDGQDPEEFLWRRLTGRGRMRRWPLREGEACPVEPVHQAGDEGRAKPVKPAKPRAGRAPKPTGSTTP